METTKATDDKPFGGVTAEDLLRYEGLWIVAFRGRIRGVGRTLNAALRRARLPEGVEPHVERAPPAEPIL